MSLDSLPLTSVHLPAEPTTQPDIEEKIARYATNVLPYNYTFDSSLSLDENYMVLTLIYARLSMSKRGNMACIVVDPSLTPVSEELPLLDEDLEPSTKRIKRNPSSAPPSLPSSFPQYPGRILSHSNNYPQPHTVPVELPQKAATKGKQVAKPKPGQTNFLIKASQFPELHAEARSICIAASDGVSLNGSTAYVSFPPCASCLPLLVATGIKRLVYRQTLGTTASVEMCRRAGVECLEFVEKELDELLKEKANNWWKQQGEGREETRTRLDRWWKKQEQEIMGELYSIAEVKMAPREGEAVSNGKSEENLQNEEGKD